MEKWFEDKLEKKNLRKYTKRRLSKNRARLSRISRKFSVTNWLIIVNVIVFFFLHLSAGLKTITQEEILSNFALQANALFSGAYWTLLTSMFTHFLLTHLIFNVISLFFIGNLLEKIIGRKKYLWFYLLSGLFAGIFAAVLSFYFGRTELGAKVFIDPTMYSVGASGAIFGIAGLLAILTPKLRVYLIAGPVFAFISLAVLASIFPESSFLPLITLLIYFYVFYSIFAIFSPNAKTRKIAMPIGMPFWVLPIIAIVPLVIVGLLVPGGLPIGNTAHLGGLIAGLAYGVYLKHKYKKKTTLIRNYFQ